MCFSEILKSVSTPAFVISVGYNSIKGKIGYSFAIVLLPAFQTLCPPCLASLTDYPQIKVFVLIFVISISFAVSENCYPSFRNARLFETTVIPLIFAPLICVNFLNTPVNTLVNTHVMQINTCLWTTEECR